MQQTLNQDHIEQLVIGAIRATNLALEAENRIEESPTAQLYGPATAMDSLTLVGLLMDIEESLRDEGAEISLGNERAMSQTKSPFRDVPALVQYICELLTE